MPINENVIDEWLTDARVMLRLYTLEMNEAYNKADEELKVGLTLSIEPDKDGDALEVGIQFITGKIKDKSGKKRVNAKQLTLIRKEEPKTLPRNSGPSNGWLMGGKWC